ncbi:HNH endonuclease [Flavobacterium sp. LAR06]|uniref:HNH endonuclease n=1 Tax=Flavobacterium sp. LAR06 TaxID=3064897 RepID=UPI0035C1F257
MIKIEKGFSSLKKTAVTLDVLALEHYNRLTTVFGNYKITPLEKLREELTKTSLVTPRTADIQLKIDFLQKVTDDNEFKKLIISPLNDFSTIITDYARFNTLFENKGYKSYMELFGYSRIRKLRMMYTFALDLGIKTCPYCNNHYVLTIKKSKKANLHFDHFYSKSKYPFLCLSFYNLVPCCSVCNTAKSDKDFNISSYVHPYFDSINDKFDVITDKNSIIDMILKGDRKFENLSIELNPKKGYEDLIKAHDLVFNLTQVYNEHKDVAFEIYSKQYIYTDSFVETLKGAFSKEFSDSEIERFILGNYTLLEEINNRPLAKLMQDIYKEARIVKATKK